MYKYNYTGGISASFPSPETYKYNRTSNSRLEDRIKKQNQRVGYDEWCGPMVIIYFPVNTSSLTFCILLMNFTTCISSCQSWNENTVTWSLLQMNQRYVKICKLKALSMLHLHSIWVLVYYLSLLVFSHTQNNIYYSYSIIS